MAARKRQATVRYKWFAATTTIAWELLAEKDEGILVESWDSYRTLAAAKANFAMVCHDLGVDPKTVRVVDKTREK